MNDQSKPVLSIQAPPLTEAFEFIVASVEYRYAGFEAEQTAHEFAKMASDQWGSQQFYVWQNGRPIARYVRGRKVGG